MSKRNELHLNLPDDLLNELDMQILQGRFLNRTQAIKENLKFAFEAQKLFTKLEDPEVVQKIRKIWTEKRLDDFVKELSTHEIKYMKMWFETLPNSKELQSTV